MLHAGAIFHRLLIEGSGKTWKQDQRIRLQHVDTGGYLHSHDKKYTRIAGGQQEVRTRNCYFFLQQLMQFAVSVTAQGSCALLHYWNYAYSSSILSINNLCVCTGLRSTRKTRRQCLVGS